MHCEFHLQDPTSPDTVYLFEALLEAAQEAVSGIGVFAFASRAGVESLIEDAMMQSFLDRGTFILLVGIDAITDHNTLVRLQELEREHDRLKVRVFRNPTDMLFHPKIARFHYQDGGQAIVVGSGNLTPGGLRQNFEAFSIIRTRRQETLDLSSWDRFFRDQKQHIRPIDDEALERASRNVSKRRDEAEAARRRRPGTAAAGKAGSSSELGRFLVARVPKAGSRWHQVHFNQAVIDQFFRVKPQTAQRVYLKEVHQDGRIGETEVRPCVYSAANKNMKIEIGSHHGHAYPKEGPPIAVFRELRARSFRYMLLMPNETGYPQMYALTDTLPSVGKGLRRVFASGDDIRGVWAECPLLANVE